MKLWICSLVAAVVGYGQTINTVVGTGYVFDGDGKPAAQAPLGLTISMAIHPLTNEPYFTDTDNHMVMRVRADGTLFVVAGNGRPGFSGDGGPAKEASLNTPRQMAFDRQGNLYIADMVNQRVRRVGTDGVITTVAGNGARGRAPEGAVAVQAPLDYPHGVAVDSRGNLYITDHFNNQLRRVDTNGRTTVFAGTGTNGFSGDGGPATAATLGTPFDVVCDRADNVLFVDAAGIRIRRIRTNGVIETAAGNGSIQYSGDGGNAIQAGLGGIGSLGVDAQGNLYIGSVTSHNIRRVTASDGRIAPYAANGSAGFSGDNGPALQAQVFSPEGLGVDASGNLYIADRNNRRVRRVTAAGTISTIAGNGFNRSFVEFGPVRTANLLQPYAMAVDGQGNLYIADTFNARIRKVTTDGRISTIAGNGTPGYAGDGGPALQARIDRPLGIAVDKSGNVYFTQPGNGENVVRRITPDGRISLFAGSLKAGPVVDNVPALEATFYGVIPIAVEESGSILVGDALNHTIRRIGTDGRVRTVIGTGKAGFTPDGSRAAGAAISYPGCVVPDRLGNIYFCDSDNLRIRKIDTAGILTTVVGSGANGFRGDGGPARDAAIGQRTSPVLGADGSIYFADTLNNRVRKVDAFGVITTIAGTGVAGYSGDGGLPTAAQLFQPQAVVLDATGRLLIADTQNDRIRAILAESPAFALDKSTVTFRALQERDGSLTIPLQELGVALQTSLEGVPYESTLTALIPGGDELLRRVTRVTPASGVMPAQMKITAVANDLPLGAAFTGTVAVARLTLRAPNANPPERTVTIQLEVAPAPAPELRVGSSGLQFASVAGGAAQAGRLLVRNNGGGKIAFTVESTVPWLIPQTAAGVVAGNDPELVEVAVATAGLAPGTYSGAVTVKGDNGQSATLPASLAVSDRNSAILLTPSALSFVAIQGGGNPPAQPVSVVNSGSGAMTWSVTSRTLAGGNWLTIPSESASGTSTGGQKAPEIPFSVDASRLAPGDYSALATVSSPNSANRQQLATVSLRVLPPNSDAVPEVSPTGVVFTAVAGDEPGSATLTLTVNGGAPIEYTSVRATLDGVNWFEAVPSTGTLSPSQPARIRLFPALAKLPVGIRQGAVTIVFNDRARTVRTVSILSIVAPQGSAGAGKSGERETSSCGSGDLFAEITSLQKPRFSVRPGETVRVRSKIVDGCGRPHVPEAAGTASANLTVLNTQTVIKMTHVANGEWEGAYTPPANQTGDFSVRVVAAFTQGTKIQLGVSETATGSVQASAGPRSPQVAAGAIVNGASFVAQPLVAPGQLISIYGTDLADQALAASSVPLSTTLAGTEVLLGGESLPLLFVSNGQINAQVPFGLALNSEQQIVVRKQQALGTPERIVVGNAQPGIFSKNNNGAGQGVVLAVRPGGAQTYAEPAAPAKRGDTIVIYCSGLGPTSPAVAAGVAAPLSPLSRVVSPVRVIIGGAEAAVQFAGLTPGSAGLYQVNAVIPQDAPLGDQVPIILNVGGLDSPAVTMAVQQ